MMTMMGRVTVESVGRSGLGSARVRITMGDRRKHLNVNEDVHKYGRGYLAYAAMSCPFSSIQSLRKREVILTSCDDKSDKQSVRRWVASEEVNTWSSKPEKNGWRSP